MDNTLTDEFGSTVRPGIHEFLDKLILEKHVLLLWTNSTKIRAKLILYEHDLKKYFKKFIFREDYDINNKGLNKDIRTIDGEILIDDDPEEIKNTNSLKRKGILISSYRKGQEIPKNELQNIYKEIFKLSKKRSFF